MMTKAIIAAMAEILQRAKNLEDAYEALQNIANVEGTILGPYESKNNQEKSRS
jgi:hypothetical protein